MMRAPALAAIHAAELRVARSRQHARDGLRRARLELRSTVARPSTLILAAATIGLLAFWVVRRARMPAVAPVVGVATTASVAGLLLALAARYGMQGLSFAFQPARAARHLTIDS